MRIINIIIIKNKVQFFSGGKGTEGERLMTGSDNNTRWTTSRSLLHTQHTGLHNHNIIQLGTTEKSHSVQVLQKGKKRKLHGQIVIVISSFPFSFGLKNTKT